MAYYVLVIPVIKIEEIILKHVIFAAQKIFDILFIYRRK